MFRIDPAPIEPGDIPADDASGGWVVFEGRVRNHHDGKTVVALEYEAYAELAEREGEKILQEARERFAITQATCVHRVGLLQIGETAIRIAVGAPHRKAAFEACEFVIDELKRRVPIWKKEHYAEGVSDWLQPSESAPLRAEDYYERQLRLPFLGAAGQAKLGKSRVMVVGAGGLGGPALLYLASAGVGRLDVVDDDRVEVSNLSRQILYTVGDVGKPKAEVAAHHLRMRNPWITAVPHVRRFDREAEELLEGADLVLDGTDNFRTKFLLNDLCVKRGIPLVTASLYQTDGQLMVVDGGPCLRCLWPETPTEGCVGTCAEVGVLGVLPGHFGALAANEALKLLLGVGSVARSEMLVCDLASNDSFRIRRERDPKCPTCGLAPRGASQPDWEAEEDAEGIFIDIREPEEVQALPLPGAITAPFGSFDASAFTESGPYLLVCARGNRSGRLAKELHERGITRFKSLPGGVSGLMRRNRG